MNILVIAAHPDDEVLGVGGTIAHHATKRDQVYICIGTKAYPPDWPESYSRTKLKEQQAVDSLLGIKKRFNLGFKTAKLNTIPHGEISAKISKIIETVKPDVVYTHYEHDVHLDHSILFRSTLVAVRPPKKISLYAYETLSETEWNNKLFVPTTWIDIGKHIDKKIKAFNMYRSEVKTYPHPRSHEGIRILAQKRGMEVCLPYAEAFQLIRETKI